MRCRWMLFTDDFGELKLLGGVPRAWFQNGKNIVFEGVATRFGRLSVWVESNTEKGSIVARICLESNGAPQPTKVSIRLAHPDFRKATAVSGGEYDCQRETVILHGFCSEAKIELLF